jgi:hypothetical protein
MCRALEGDNVTFSGATMGTVEEEEEILFQPGDGEEG